MCHFCRERHHKPCSKIGYLLCVIFAGRDITNPVQRLAISCVSFLQGRIAHTPFKKWLTIPCVSCLQEGVTQPNQKVSISCMWCLQGRIAHPFKACLCVVCTVRGSTHPIEEVCLTGPCMWCVQGEAAGRHSPRLEGGPQEPGDDGQPAGEPVSGEGAGPGACGGHGDEGGVQQEERREQSLLDDRAAADERPPRTGQGCQLLGCLFGRKRKKQKKTTTPKQNDC